MSSVECPTCGKDDFASEGSMRSHHTRIHGDSLREMVELSCEWCGELYEVPSYQEDNSSFCSGSCRSKSIGAGRDPEPQPREIALERDDHTCQRCGNEVIDDLEAAKSANAHHIIPVAAGGPDVPENLVTLCEGCHSEAHRDMKHIHESNPELLGELREVVCEDD